MTRPQSRRPRVAFGLALSAALFAFVAQALAQTYHREEIRIPMAGAGPRGLEALLVRPEAPGAYPLVIVSHGAPRNAGDSGKMTPWSSYPVALEFARRGWAAVIVMRRGYGDSGGRDVERNGSCSEPDYFTSGRTSAQDIRAAIKDIVRRPDIDGSRILAVGQSAGGFATVALTAEPPPGLVAAISFAGGRGSVADFAVCNEDRLIAAMRIFGKTSRIPMLWVYAENDHYFPPLLAEQMRSAFADSGGKVEFIRAPPFDKDGHSLFSLTGIPNWTPYVDSFLAKQHLAMRASPLPLPPLPKVNAPRQLSRNGQKTFELYLRGAPHKAFAVSPDGHFGWQTGKRDVADAKEQALKFCGNAERECRIVFVDDEAAR